MIGNIPEDITSQDNVNLSPEKAPETIRRSEDDGMYYQVLPSIFFI